MNAYIYFCDIQSVQASEYVCLWRDETCSRILAEDHLNPISANLSLTVNTSCLVYNNARTGKYLDLNAYDKLLCSDLKLLHRIVH